MSSLAKNYNRRKIAFKRGKGSFLYATNGKKYLDFVQGIAVNSLGHANPYLIKSINKQAKKLKTMIYKAKNCYSYEYHCSQCKCNNYMTSKSKLIWNHPNHIPD